MPPQRFSDWKNWLSRTSLDDLRSPGVYALAVSDHDLSDAAFSWLPQIVYFGMTNSLAGLAGRLKQFDNTINGKFGHGARSAFVETSRKRKSCTHAFLLQSYPSSAT